MESKKPYEVRVGKLDQHEPVYFVWDTRVDMWVDYWPTKIQAQRHVDRRNRGLPGVEGRHEEGSL